MPECSPGEFRELEVHHNWEVVDMFWLEVDGQFFFWVTRRLAQTWLNHVAVAGYSVKYIDRGISIKLWQTIT